MMMGTKFNGIHNVYHRIDEIYKKIHEIQKKFDFSNHNVNNNPPINNHSMNDEHKEIEEDLKRDSSRFNSNTNSSKRKIKEFIDYISRENGVSPALIQAIAQVESNYNPNAISPKGAIGIMQLMPQTAKELNVNPFDIEENIKGGIEYLKRLATKYKDLDMVLAAYNAGPSNVEKYRGIPPFTETQNYIKKIKKILNQIED